MRRNAPGLNVSLQPGSSAVPGALALVDEFVRVHLCAPDLAMRLAVVVEELVANIVEHGGVPPGDSIDLGISSRRGAVVVAIRDAGAPFDPRAAPDPGELPPERGGGAGIGLVRAWSKIRSYRRTARHNELVVELASSARA